MFDYTRKITVSEIMGYDPCDDYPETLISELVGDGLTLAEILDAPVPDKDKLWLVLRPEIIAENDLHGLACTFAERVAYLNPDPRVKAAIDAKRAWLRGDITLDDLAAARAAAYDAACSALAPAADAARAAAYAAYAAADAAADAAARAAAYDAACSALAPAAQVLDIRDMLKSKGF